MACLKNELRTKDKKQVDYIYKKLKGYALLLGQNLGDSVGTSKEAKIQWIEKAYSNGDVLNSVVSNITIKENCYLENMVKFYCSDFYNYSCKYWENMGLLNVNFDAEVEELSICFVDEIIQFVKSGENEFFEKIGLKAMINSVVSSMVNLYGIIDFKKAYEIFCGITLLGNRVDYGLFMDTAVRFADFRDEFDICVYADCFVSCDYVEINMSRGIKHIVPNPTYYELICKQGDKPYYTVFNIEQLLCYEYPGSFEIDSYIDDFIRFLSETFDQTDNTVYIAADEVCKSCIEESGINEIFSLLENKGFCSKSQKIQKSLVKHIMQIKNNIRLRANRGYSINELRSISYDSTMVCSNL